MPGRGRRRAPVVEPITRPATRSQRRDSLNIQPPVAGTRDEDNGPYAPAINNSKRKRPTVCELSETVSALSDSISVLDRNAAKHGDTLGRVVNLEKEVRKVNATIQGLDSKLDLLVNNVVRDSANDFCANTNDNNSSSQNLNGDVQVVSPPTHARQRRSTQPRPYGRTLGAPPPARLRDIEDWDGSIQEMIEAEQYPQASGHGKPIYEPGSRKPYMYIVRDGAETERQKLELRNTITSIEYIDATLQLIQDKGACNKADIPHILKHLSCVTTDIMARPWVSVRKWSQHIWDAVEKKKCSWKDYLFIQDERIRLSFTSSGMGQPQSSNVTQTASDPLTTCLSVETSILNMGVDSMPRMMTGRRGSCMPAPSVIQLVNPPIIQWLGVGLKMRTRRTTHIIMGHRENQGVGATLAIGRMVTTRTIMRDSVTFGIGDNSREMDTQKTDRVHRGRRAESRRAQYEHGVRGRRA